MSGSWFQSFTRASFLREPSRSIVLSFLLLIPTALAHAADGPSLAIKVDQVGYPLNGSKVALVALQNGPANPAYASFQVLSSADNSVVFRGKLLPPEADANSGDQVQAADFSSLRKPGTYYIEIPGMGRSWSFAIGENVFEHTYYMAMRGFYGQRCGTAVDMGAEFPGYSH
jgi:endoglucanase